MSKGKFDAAKDLIESGRYDEARQILETMRSNERAQKWLRKLDKIAPDQRSGKARVAAITRGNPVGCLLRSLGAGLTCGVVVIALLAVYLFANLMNVAGVQPINQAFAAFAGSTVGRPVTNLTSGVISSSVGQLQPALPSLCQSATNEATQQLCQTVGNDVISCVERYGADLVTCMDRAGVSACNALYTTAEERRTCLDSYQTLGWNAILSAMNGNTAVTETSTP